MDKTARCRLTDQFIYSPFARSKRRGCDGTFHDKIDNVNTGERINWTKIYDAILENSVLTRVSCF